MAGKETMKQKVTGVYGKTYAPFVLVAVIGMLYHLRMQPMGGDDIFFAQATDGTTLWAYLAHRYVNWTSRVVSEFVLVNVIRIPILWRVLNLLMFVTFPVILSKLFKKGRMMNWCAAGAVLLFPFHDMGTAGWITTTVTHFWPLWGICYLGLLIKKTLTNERIRVGEVILGLLTAVVTCSHEQYCVILLVIFLLYGFYLWQQKRGNAAAANAPLSNLTGAKRTMLLALIVINIASVAVILLCPGNAARNAVSIADLPVYETFGFGDKLYLGLLSIERVFIANADAVFFAVVFIWTLLVYIKTDDYKKTLFSGLPLLILFGQTVLLTAYPGLSGLFAVPGQILEWNWTELSAWIPMGYLIVTVAAMIYALYQIFGENLTQYFFALILLGCGFGAGMVLGFMATIYVSGERVYAPLYAILILVTLAGISKQKSAVEVRLATAGGKLAVTVLTILCLVNVLFVTLSV